MSQFANLRLRNLRNSRRLANKHTFPAKDVIAARALLLRAVWSAISWIALAAHRLLPVPRQLVCSPLGLRQCLLVKTDTAARAVVRTGSALTRFAVVVFKAVAFSNGLVAYSLVRTLHPWVRWLVLLGETAERAHRLVVVVDNVGRLVCSPRFSPSTSVVGAHAVPLGHVRREQSAPVQAAAQKRGHRQRKNKK